MHFFQGFLVGTRPKIFHKTYTETLDKIKKICYNIKKRLFLTAVRSLIEINLNGTGPAEDFYWDGARRLIIILPHYNYNIIN